MLATMPATGEGMGATAFSFSISTMVWPLAMRSPALTKILTTVPDSAPSPSLGSLTSIKIFDLKQKQNHPAHGIAPDTVEFRRFCLKQFSGVARREINP